MVDVTEHKQRGNLSEKKLGELEVRDSEDTSLRHTHLAGSIENRHSATLPFARNFRPQRRQGWEI